MDTTSDDKSERTRLFSSYNHKPAVFLFCWKETAVENFQTPTLLTRQTVVRRCPFAGGKCYKVSLNLGAQKICPMHHHLPHHRIQSVDLLCVPDFQNNFSVSCCPKTHWMNSDEPHLKHPNLLQLRTQWNKQAAQSSPPPAPSRLAIPVAREIHCAASLPFPLYNFLVPSFQSADVGEAVVSPDTPPAAVSIGADGVQLRFCLCGLTLQENISRSHPFPVAGCLQAVMRDAKAQLWENFEGHPAPDHPIWCVETCVYHHSPNSLSTQPCSVPTSILTAHIHKYTNTHWSQGFSPINFLPAHLWLGTYFPGNPNQAK